MRLESEIKFNHQAYFVVNYVLRTSEKEENRSLTCLARASFFFFLLPMFFLAPPSIPALPPHYYRGNGKNFLGGQGDGGDIDLLVNISLVSLGFYLLCQCTDLQKTL